MYHRIYWLCACISIWGCGPRPNMRDYIAIHESAANAIPAAVQMEELYGNADHFITHFGFDRKPKLWNTEVFFGGRYTLTMQVNVQIDYGRKTLTPVNEAKFYLIGADSITVLPDGRTSTSYAGDQHWFTLSEWEKVYESGGDFGEIGITTNPEPVPGFDADVANARRPPIPITLVRLPYQ